MLGKILYLKLILKLCLFIIINPSFSNSFEQWKSDLAVQAINAGISKKVVYKNMQSIFCFFVKIGHANCNTLVISRYIFHKSPFRKFFHANLP